jgi:alcohol dehydrogenase YqhD (iron-dependent ADH family)
MNPFELHIPTKLLFGKQKGDSFFTSVAELGSHTLLVIGGGSVERLGYLDTVIAGLESKNVRYTLFKGIEPNPQAATINKAAEAGRKAGVNSVLALGGGSVMDASKAIAALIHDNETDIWEFVLGEPRRGKLKGALPIITIPTTAATASEVTPNAVISNSAVKGKSPIGYPFMKPVLSWLNPAMHTKLPADITCDGAADILSHVFENYLLGGNDSPFTDRFCEGIMETVMETLPLILEDPENEELRGRMQWVSALALSGLHSAGRKPGPFTMHSLEHALSGYNPELAHGRGLATIFPAYFRWMWENDRARDRLALLGVKLFDAGETDTEAAGLAFIRQFEKWLMDHNLYQRLDDIGIPEMAYSSIADYAIKVYGDGEKLDAAGPLSKDDILDIFHRTKKQARNSIKHAVS